MPAPIAAIIASVGFFGGTFLLQQAPIARAITYFFNSLWPNAELEPVDLLDMYFRGKITLQQLEERMKSHGIDISKTKELITLSKRIINIETAIMLYRRNIINEKEFKEIMIANRVAVEDIPLYLKATEYMPGPSDIIRFAVREVFTPEIVEEYRMLEDLPPKFLELAKQVGIPEEVAKWYWAAHWDLPSLTMGFEMFRRKIITADELKTLMRTLDIMPGWRDKLLQLAYEIPTRVDVRRMYELGVIDRNKVKEYYEKLGYTPEDAELLTRWTEVEYAAQDRDLTVKQVLELYEIGEFSREQAKKYLIKLGFPDDVAEYKLTLYEHEIAYKQAKEQLKLLKQMFLGGLIPFEKFVDEIYKLPFNARTIELEIAKTVKEKQAKQKLPSLQTLRRWLKYQIITVEKFVDYMKRLGYSDEDIKYYLLELMPPEQQQEQQQQQQQQTQT